MKLFKKPSGWDALRIRRAREVEALCDQSVRMSSGICNLEILIKHSTKPDPKLCAELERQRAAFRVWDQIIKMRFDEFNRERLESQAQRYPEANRKRAVELMQEMKREIWSVSTRVPCSSRVTPGLLGMTREEYDEALALDKRRVEEERKAIAEKYNALFAELMA